PDWKRSRELCQVVLCCYLGNADEPARVLRSYSREQVAFAVLGRIPCRYNAREVLVPQQPASDRAGQAIKGRHSADLATVAHPRAKVWLQPGGAVDPGGDRRGFLDDANSVDVVVLAEAARVAAQQPQRADG